MSLNLQRKTVSGSATVFAKIFELFTGGFSLTITGLNSGEVLPEGSFLKVDESARTALPVKTAVTAKDSVDATNHVVVGGHHFQVGDSLGVGGTAYNIQEITPSGDNDILRIGTATETVGTGVVLYESSAVGDGNGAVKNLPNAILRYEVTIEDGATVTALRRGTVYKNRIQGAGTKFAGTPDLYAGLPATIQLSESY